ncbi:MAG: lycopene cyclase domain-containing protein [Actinomycetales bacterium]|nr:lycopene cyclase domain-containing protein [Actinomycetales bacterium]
MTYLLIDLPFLAVAIVVAAVAWVRGRRASRAAWALAAVGVLVLTAVFDNVLVGTGIVGYDPALISGVRIGVAPIEDFAYAVAGLLLLPALWDLLPARGGGGPGEASVRAVPGPAQRPESTPRGKRAAGEEAP